ncbi:hypothetical protein IT411_00175, partial [Candidatus Peregrinibacteria bacterium]|nr:hypothetical protein [Candidatus Peregrinibacteria bacterium]
MFKIRTTIIATVFLGIAMAGTAQAAVEHLSLPVCNLAVYPLNPAKAEIYGDAAVPFVNFLSESLCKARTPYGQPYNQPPTKAQNPLVSVANIEDKNVPYAQHYHAYINNALEDSYYYRSFVDKFEITLESDALANMNKLDLQCQTPAPGSYSGSAAALADCNGQINDTNFYGGVKVSYNSTTGVVTWEFGTVDKNKRPNMWGNNDSNPADSDNFNEVLTAVYGVPANLSDYTSVYRRFRPSVVLHTKNNPQEIWSGTTTSRALIRNYAILKSSFNAISNNNAKFSSLCSSLGDFTKWCPVATPSGQGFATENYGSQEWFWFPIGSVVSVWRQPPPPVDLACEDLQWDGPFLKKNSVGVFSPAITNPNALLQNEEALMKFKTIYQSGSGTQRPLEYHWTAFYGEQNRPTWFKYEDTIFLGPIMPLLTTSLPAKLLNVAHAAPLPGSSIDIGPIGDASINTDLIQSIVIIGKFKDEIASSLSYNPLVDDDFKAYYSGGSEGVTLGVQAFYADGKNVAGQGAMVQTSQGLKQKANKCPLELTIQPP